MPSILHGLFEHDLIKHSNGKYTIYASYFENYNKDVYDLLIDKNEQIQNNDKENFNPYSTKHRQTNKVGRVKVMALGGGNVDMGNLSNLQVLNAKQALNLIEAGNLKRSKAHTRLNTVLLHFFLHIFAQIKHRK